MSLSLTDALVLRVLRLAIDRLTLLAFALIFNIFDRTRRCTPDLVRNTSSSTQPLNFRLRQKALQPQHAHLRLHQHVQHEGQRPEREAYDGEQLQRREARLTN